MKMIILTILGIVFAWYFIKGVIQSWPIGWPFLKTNLLDSYSAVQNLKLQSRLGKEAVKSLVICLIIAVFIQAIL